MPVSSPENISPIIIEALRLRPKTILDLGIGFGKFGVLLREYLDIEAGRLQPSQYKTIIMGVEGFNTYRNPNWKQYTGVEIADFSDPEEVIRYQGFDLVMMIDSLEHLDAKTGNWLLDILLDNNKNVIVSVPTGAGYGEQGAVFGNEYERHRHHWKDADFVVRGGRLVHSGTCIVYTLKGRG